jgi:hypothetical protein
MEMKAKNTLLMLLALVLVVSAAPMFAQSPPSERAITPTTYPGNFVSSDDDQVCYDMSALGYIDVVTSEMRGLKIDPPVDFSNDYISTEITNKGTQLAWESASGVSVLAFIIKGGPNFNVYDYVGTGFSWDAKLVSPFHKGRIPAISHYNVCYTVPAGATGGCTRGYWSNHADRWYGVDPADDFDTTFGVELFSPDITLGDAITSTGGGLNQFAAQATAALLNSYGGVPNADDTTVNYPFTTAEVIQMVQDAATSGFFDATKDLFDAANNLGCPLSGTRAVPVQ